MPPAVQSRGIQRRAIKCAHSRSTTDRLSSIWIQVQWPDSSTRNRQRSFWVLRVVLRNCVLSRLSMNLARGRRFVVLDWRGHKYKFVFLFSFGVVDRVLVQLFQSIMQFRSGCVAVWGCRRSLSSTGGRWWTLIEATEAL